MATIITTLTTKIYRKKWGVYAGKARLAYGFKTEKEALEHIEENKDILLYWANSAGVGIQNTKPEIVHL